MTEKLSGVILAGGTGSRFHGRIKTKIVVEGETIISRIISVLTGIFNEIIIVTNTPDEFADFTSCRTVQDEIRNAGPLGGIHAAMKAASGKSIFVFAGDMPFLERDIISGMIEAYANSHAEVLIPEVTGYIEPLHAIYSVSLTSHLENYLNEGHSRAVRDYIELLKVVYIPFEGSETIKKAFTNINLPSDIDHK
jgi:molybdopterin-guanine dinucleotide biosynthesis protein A